MNQFNRKMNRILKKIQNPCTFAAGVFIAIGLILHEGLNVPVVPKVFLLVATALCGLPVLYRGIMGLFAKAIGIEVLVSIAVIGALFIGEFHEAAIVTFLFQFGNFLEQRTISKTRGAIRALTEMAPQKALRIDYIGAEPEEVDADDIEEGELLLVRTGAMIPVDGEVVQGEGYVEEASITGESKPIHKLELDQVFAGTILDSGSFVMKATRVGEDTTFAKIIALVEEAQDAKSPVERFVDRFAKWYTPCVVLAAIIIFIITGNLETAITVLVLACPGALVIGAPVANVAGIGRGAKQHILLKGGDSVFTYAKTDTFVFDKTGTLTKGRPSVTQVQFFADNTEVLLQAVGGIEKSSDHPLAQAVVQYIESQKMVCPVIATTEVRKGAGIVGTCDLGTIFIGNEMLITEQVTLQEEELSAIRKMKEEGCSVVLISNEERLLLLFGIRDELRPEAAAIMEDLKRAGIKQTIMLTGDHEKTAELVSAELGIDQFYSNLLPQDKLALIQKYQEEGRHVAFVGDGVNDSPALALSDTGIAVGGGTDVVIEISDVVLMKDGIIDLATSYDLAKSTVRVLWENIVIAVGTVVLLLVGLLLGYIHMASGMFIHEASILVVIINAMRLLMIKETKGL